MQFATSPCCPACGDSRSTSAAFSAAGHAIHGCRACGAEFAHPQPSDEVLASIYTPLYFLGSDDPAAKARVSDLKCATARVYLDAIQPVVSAPSPRLLEIGCGSGDFLLEAADRGFDVEAIEYSPHAADSVNARMQRAVVKSGSIDTLPLAPNSYDVIAAFDVIEHVRDPQSFLSRVNTLLKPDGVAVIVTPSLDSLTRRMMGRFWMEYKMEHLTYFGRASLGALFNRTGFAPIHVRPNSKVLTLDYVTRHFVRFPVPLATALLRVLRAITPESIANRPFRISSSGIIAIARKQDWNGRG